MKHRKLSLIWYILAKTFFVTLAFLFPSVLQYILLLRHGALLPFPAGDWQVWWLSERWILPSTWDLTPCVGSDLVPYRPSVKSKYYWFVKGLEVMVTTQLSYLPLYSSFFFFLKMEWGQVRTMWTRMKQFLVRITNDFYYWTICLFVCLN